MKSKKIILWPAADEVYILAMYLNRCGTVKGYEGFTVSCPTRWLPVSYTHLTLPTNREV